MPTYVMLLRSWAPSAQRIRFMATPGHSVAAPCVCSSRAVAWPSNERALKHWHACRYPVHPCQSSVIRRPHRTYGAGTF